MPLSKTRGGNKPSLKAQLYVLNWAGSRNECNLCYAVVMSVTSVLYPDRDVSLDMLIPDYLENF